MGLEWRVCNFAKFFDLLPVGAGRFLKLFRLKRIPYIFETVTILNPPYSRGYKYGGFGKWWVYEFAQIFDL